MSEEKEKKVGEKVTEVCQECGAIVEVKTKCPTGFVCDNCLAIARDDRGHSGEDDNDE